MSKLLAFLTLLLLPATAMAQTLLSSSATLTGTSTPLVLTVLQYQEFNITLTANTPIQFNVPVIAGTLIFRLNLCEGNGGGWAPVYSIVQGGNTLVNNLGSTMFNTTVGHCETQQWSWRQQSKQLVLESDTALTGAPSQTLPINQLPAQTGNYNAQGFALGNLPAVTATNQALSEGHAIGGTTPAAGTFTALTANSSLTATGTTSITGATSGGNPLTNVDVNKAVNPLGHGVVCDGSTDNNPSSSGPLQLAINAAGVQAGPSTGYFVIPASCNPASGHTLVFSTGITIPENVKMVGLAGQCWDGDTHCVEMDYSGNSVAVTSLSTHGAGFENIRVKNTGSGTIGLLLDSTFRARVIGASFEGFSSWGIELTDSAATSESNEVEQTSSFNNGGALLLDGTANSAKANGNNLFVNDNLWGSTGNYNVVMQSFTATAGAMGYQNVYRNVFLDDDVSNANKSAIVGIQSNATLDTDVVGLTAESLQTVYQLTAGTQNFNATGEGAILSTSPTGVFTASGDSTYKICIGYIAGVGGNKCWSTIPEIDQYDEPANLQDPTGQFGEGLRENRVTHSEDFTNGAWANSGITSTGNTATSPAGVSNGATAAVLTNGGASYFMQTYTLGSSIANTCWTGSVWLQAQSGTARTQLVLFNSAGVQLSNSALTSGMITTTWQRFYVTGCAAGSDSHTGIEFRPMYFATAPTATINLWGAQLTETNGPARYVKTVASVITDDIVGLSTAGLFIPPTLVGSLPAACQPGDVRTVSDWNGTNGTCTGGGADSSPAVCGASNTWYCP